MTTFPVALGQLFAGEASAIRRAAWDSGMSVFIEPPTQGSRFTEPFLCLRTWKQGEPTKLVPYEPGNASLFAQDWEIESNFAR